jgi:hypothetical protein
VDPRLSRRWSARRQVIDVRQAELATAFVRDHGRPPTRVEMLELAQQATLETGHRKHESRTFAEQRANWRTQAIETLGGPDHVDAVLHQALNPPAPDTPTVTPAWRAQAADRVVATLEEHGATWQYWHLWAEAQRQMRGITIDPADVTKIAEAVVDKAIARPIQLTGANNKDGVPDHLRGSRR